MSIDRMANEVCRAFEDSDMALRYSQRHGIASQAVLTVTNDDTADLIASHLEPRIAGKTVVEIGGGLGLLSLHMGAIAKRVYCIEANPIWSVLFAMELYHQKPKNVSFLLGAADEFVECIKADVALFCTHSGVESMRLVATQFAPEVIDVYGELIAASPDKFDPLASILRKVA